MRWIGYAIFAVASVAFIEWFARWGMGWFGPTGGARRTPLMSDKVLWRLVAIGIVMFVGGLATGSLPFMLGGVVFAGAEFVTLNMYRNWRR